MGRSGPRREFYKGHFEKYSWGNPKGVALGLFCFILVMDEPSLF